MTGKERVYRTIDFASPDRIPVDIWPLPAAYKFFGETLTDMITEREMDILIVPLFDPTKDLHQYDLGIHVDCWGCEWHNHQEGITGETKAWPLDGLDVGGILKYKPPTYLLHEYRREIAESAKTFVDANSDRFLLAGWSGLFERMQYLRGIENLFCDIAYESDEFFRIRDIVFEYSMEYFSIVSAIDGVDGCIIADDWGTQISMLISPESWRRLFKPCYKQMIDLIKSNGKRVFFHSDGNILDIYNDFIELGVSAIWSQVWCMGLPEVAELTKSGITMWGELDRQKKLPGGTPDDVQHMIDEMKLHFWNGGGLIGMFEVNVDVPIENVRTGLFGW